MINRYSSNIPIYSATSFSEIAQVRLIRDLLAEEYFKTPKVQRLLASYPCANEDEKDQIVLQIMTYLWSLPQANDIFKVFRDFDAVFSILGKKGHFIHQFEVFLLGHFILQKLLKLDKEATLLRFFKIIDRLHYSWLIAANAHDFGYPLQMHNELSEKFSILYDRLHLKKVSKLYESIIKGYKISEEIELANAKVFNLREGKNIKIDLHSFIFNSIKISFGIDEIKTKEVVDSLINNSIHGYASALILCKKYFEYLSKAKLYGLAHEDWRINILQYAASAIAIHATKKEDIINQISFENNPISYLLFLVDNLQEWSRTLRPNDKYASYNLDSFSFDENPSTIYLNYILTHEKWEKSVIKDVKASLEEKRLLLSSWLSPPINTYNLKIQASFTASHGYEFEPIEISL